LIQRSSKVCLDHSLRDIESHDRWIGSQDKGQQFECLSS
jgi:hypothetical protein